MCIRDRHISRYNFINILNASPKQVFANYFIRVEYGGRLRRIKHILDFLERHKYFSPVINHGGATWANPTLLLYKCCIQPCCIPVRTRGCFDVHKTSITLKRRRTDVKITSCVYWDSIAKTDSTDQHCSTIICWIFDAILNLLNSLLP